MAKLEAMAPERLCWDPRDSIVADTPALLRPTAPSRRRRQRALTLTVLSPGSTAFLQSKAALLKELGRDWKAGDRFTSVYEGACIA